MISFKAALLAFWALWFWIVFLTNLFGALKAAGRLPPDWRFASGNYQAIVKAAGKYQPPRWLCPLLFAGVILWQLSAAALFTRAWIGGEPQAVELAFAVGIALWAAFMLADEITLEYEFERTHELLFTAQLASLLAWRLLPD